VSRSETYDAIGRRTWRTGKLSADDAETRSPKFRSRHLPAELCPSVTNRVAWLVAGLREERNGCEGGERDERITSLATGPDFDLARRYNSSSDGWGVRDRTRNLRIKSTVIRFSGPPACADAAASTSDRAQFAGVPASPLAGSLAATSRPAARAKISGPVARSMPTGTRVPEGEPGIVPNSRDDAAEHHGPGRCRGDCRWTSSLRLVHGPGRKVMVAGGKPRGQYEDDGASGQARSY